MISAVSINISINSSTKFSAHLPKDGPSWSKLNTAAMLHDVFSVTKTHYVLELVWLNMLLC